MVNKTRFETGLEEITKNIAYFYQHTNCHHFDDNAGDIKVYPRKSSQNTACASYHLIFDEFNVTGQDLKESWMQLEKDGIFLLAP